MAQVAQDESNWLALLGNNGIATIFNQQFGRTRMTLKGKYQGIAITPTSGLLCATRGERVGVWDCSDRCLLGRLVTGTPQLVHATDELILVGVENVLSVWRNADRKRIAELRLDEWVCAVAARGRDIVVATISGEVHALAIAGLNLPPTDSTVV